MRLLTVVVPTLRRVLVDPVRAGRLRWEATPPGLRAVGRLGQLAVAGTIGLTVAAHLAIDRLPLRAGFGEVSVAAAPTLLLLGLVLATALVLAGAIHAPLPLRLLALLLAALVLAVPAAGHGPPPGPITAVVPPAAWVLLAGWLLARSRFSPAWWEFAVCWVLINLGVLAPRWELPPGIEPVTANMVQLQLVLLTGWAVPALIWSGVALAEVAASTAAWLSENSRAGLSGRGLRVLLALSVVVVVGSGTVGLIAGPGLRHLDRFGFSVLVLALMLASWAVVVGLTGTPRVATVRDLGSGFGRVGWTVVLIVGVPVLLQLSILVGVSMAQLAFPEAAWLGAALQLRERVAAARASIDGAAAWAAALGCLLLLTRAMRGGRAVEAGLAAVAAVGLTARAATSTWPLPGWSPGDAALALSLLVAGVWLGLGVRGRLSPRRSEALLAAIWLSFALAHPDLISDPIGVALGATGSAAMLLGLIWNTLTAGDLADGDSPRLPRAARAQLVLGLLLVGALLAASQATIKVSGATNPIPALVRLGTEVIGAALLVSGVLAALSAALADREFVNRQPRSGSEPG